jgi:subtilase family serine protease
VTFTTASGDDGAGSSWPAVSPNVVSVGGTALYTGAGGAYASEAAWDGSGGDSAWYEPAPTWQAAVTGDAWRDAPDVAYNADPATGFSVYDSYAYQGRSGWLTIGGTSAGAPQWAALVAIADQGRALAGKAPLDGAAQTLPALYRLPQADFHDITWGDNGWYFASPGYDLVTGRGSPVANAVVSGLVGVSGAAASKAAVAAAKPAAKTPATRVAARAALAGAAPAESTATPAAPGRTRPAFEPLTITPASTGAPSLATVVPTRSAPASTSPDDAPPPLSFTAPRDSRRGLDLLV